MEPVSGLSGADSVLSRIDAIRARIESLGGGAVVTAPATRLGEPASSGGVSAQSLRFGEVMALESGTPGMERAFAWGASQIGKPYTGSLKYRMGEPWGVEPVPLPSSAEGSEKTYWYPAGTVSYDCSGFATRFYQAMGVDLEKYGATNSRSMASTIPEVPASDLRRGDLLIIDSDHDGTPDHVQIYRGEGRVIESSVRGVAVADANFKDLYRVVRPSLLQS